MTNIDTNQMEKENEPVVLASKEGETLANGEALKTNVKLSGKEEELKKYAKKKEEEIAESSLKTLIDCFKSDCQKIISDLKNTAEDIKKEGYFLGLLPEKTGEHLLSLIPQISEALHKRVLEDFDHQLELRSVKMTEMFQKLEARHSSIDQSLSTSHAKQLENLNVLNARFQEVQNIQLKRKILTYLTSTLFLIGVALSACWTTFKYFPSKVLINEGNSVTVQGSDVTVWSKDYKLLDKVTNKEGSRPSKR